MRFYTSPTFLLFVLIVYVSLALVILIKDPTGHIQYYKSIYIVLTFVGFLAIFGLLLLKVQTRSLRQTAEFLNMTNPYRFFTAFFGTLIGLAVVWLIVYLSVQYGVNQQSSTSGATLFMLNFIIAITTMALIYLNIKKFTPPPNKYSYFNLLLNILFYIPCYFIDFIDFIKKQYNITKRTELIILAIDLLLIIVYKNFGSIINFKNALLYSEKILLKEPLKLNNKQTIGTFKELHSDKKWAYYYIIDAKIYINAQPPSTSSSYSKYTSLLNYNSKPNILYKGETNTIKIVFKLNNDMEESIIIKKNILLQKWNNFRIIYDRGTVDVFLNNILIGTKKSIAPYMTYDNITVGDTDGIHGGIKDVTYFSK